MDSVATAFEISVKLKSEDDQASENTYLPLSEAIKAVKQTKDEVPFPKAQPKRFTVHASADPSKSFVSAWDMPFISSAPLDNPYNEVIDFEDMDALNEKVDETTMSTTKKESSKSKSSSSSSKKSSRDKPQQPTNQSNKRAALVVQQLPPPMLLPP